MQSKIQLFGISNCNTVKKARDWLDLHGFAYTFHDFKKQGIDATMLESWLGQYAWEKIVNRAGITWRNLSNAEKAAVIDQESAIQLMLQKTSVIKRPILEKNSKIVCLGFDEAIYQQLIN